MACPRCGGTLTSDPRFVQWCPACEWGMDPGGKAQAAAPRGWRGRWSGKLAERLTRQVFDEVSRDHRLTSHRSSALRLASNGLALSVHLVTALLWVAAFMVARAAEGSPVGLAFAAGVALYGVLLRPRFGRMPKEALVRKDAPALFGLVDQVGQGVGAPRVDRVLLTDDHNAGYAEVGLRRAPLLMVGVPLWTLLDPPQRVALLGHEVAHAVNGDVRRGLLVDSALRSLEAWHGLLSPSRELVVGDQIGVAWVAETVVRVIHLPLAALVRLIWRTILRLSLPDSQRSEYLADRLAADVAGRAATLSLLDVSGALAACERALPRLARDATPLWSQQRAYFDSLPEGERERLRRLQQRRPRSLDDSHPPLHLRAAFLQDDAGAGGAGAEGGSEDRPTPVVLDDDQSRRIDAELARFFKAVEDLARAGAA